MTSIELCVPDALAQRFSDVIESTKGLDVDQAGQQALEMFLASRQKRITPTIEIWYEWDEFPPDPDGERGDLIPDRQTAKTLIPLEMWNDENRDQAVKSYLFVATTGKDVKNFGLVGTQKDFSYSPGSLAL